MEEEFGPTPTKQIKEEGIKRGILPAGACHWHSVKGGGHFTKKGLQLSHPCGSGLTLVNTQEVLRLLFHTKLCPFKHFE
jgi:hypothetical protein